VEIRALTWNLYHGRDAPPNPALHTWRSRLLGTVERNATHVQVNRELFDEFTSVVANAPWDIALLQECPPRWAEPLAISCDAAPHLSLTSRNWLARVTVPIARRRPDLIGSWEGGSNLTLVRGARVDERRELVIRRRHPERRTMAFTRLESGVCVANLHATNDRPRLAAAEVLMAAETALRWAGESPLIFGGDLNVRPRETGIYRLLADRFGLQGPTSPDAIDHLLACGLETVEPPRRWPPERREVAFEGLALRLSDHAPVEAEFTVPG
jgi:endonuclease/exonuclease/phosphatase family metal-dependent hydrolase